MNGRESIFEMCSFQVATSKTNPDILRLILDVEEDPLLWLINAAIRQFAREALKMGWNPYEEKLGDYSRREMGSTSFEEDLIKALNAWSEAYARDKETPTLVFIDKNTNEYFKTPDYVYHQIFNNDQVKEMADFLAKRENFH